MARSPKVLPNTGVDGTSRSRPPQVSPDVGSRRHGGKWRQLFSGVALTRRNCPIGATFPQPCLGKSVVPYRLTLDTFCTEILSCHHRNNDALGQMTECRGSGSSDACEVIPMGPCHSL